MIELKNVSKAYGKQKILEEFDLSIAKGEHIAVRGRSGAGKTTLIRLLLGLTKPDSGSLTLPEDIRIGVVFQEDRLIEALSAVGNVSVVQDSPPEQSEISELFARLGLGEELIYKPVSELSGGERRRVCIARALATDAELYIFDEAFKGIDKQTLSQVTDTVKAMTEGKTFILITHDDWEAKEMCERVVKI